MGEPLKFTSDAAWLRELSRSEVPFGSAGQPREIRAKAERFEEIADKLEGYASKLDAALKEIAELRKELERERDHICEEPPE